MHLNFKAALVSKWLHDSLNLHWKFDHAASWELQVFFVNYRAGLMAHYIGVGYEYKAQFLCLEIYFKLLYLLYMHVFV